MRERVNACVFARAGFRLGNFRAAGRGRGADKPCERAYSAGMPRI
jgi:hypothetical protein